MACGQRPYSAEHVADRQLEAASDTTIWAYALRENATIITKDEDFALRKTLNDPGPAVVWIRLPNTRRRELLARFESVLPDVISAQERGESFVEVM